MCVCVCVCVCVCARTHVYIKVVLSAFRGERREINTVLPTLPADTLDPLTNLEELCVLCGCFFSLSLSFSLHICTSIKEQGH